MKKHVTGLASTFWRVWNSHVQRLLVYCASEEMIASVLLSHLSNTVCSVSFSLQPGRNVICVMHEYGSDLQCSVQYQLTDWLQLGASCWQPCMVDACGKRETFAFTKMSKNAVCNKPHCAQLFCPNYSVTRINGMPWMISEACQCASSQPS